LCPIPQPRIPTVNAQVRNFRPALIEQFSLNVQGELAKDVAFSKTVALLGRLEKCNLQFRAEFFNMLNLPQFANPHANFTSPTFGVISSTAVNARVGQLALRFRVLDSLVPPETRR
jgi:hypothetical protein